MYLDIETVVTMASHAEKLLGDIVPTFARVVNPEVKPVHQNCETLQTETVRTLANRLLAMLL